MKPLLLVLISVIALQAFADSSSRITLDNNSDRIFIGPHVEVFEDTSGELKLDEVLTHGSEQFARFQSDTLNFGYTDSTYWLKLDVSNQGEDDRWFVELAYALIDEFTLYQLDKFGRVTEASLGRLFPVNKDSEKTYYYIHELSLSTGEEKTLLLKLKSADSLALPISIMSYSQLHTSAKRQYVFWSVYLGALLVMALYNLFLWVSLREKVYLLYVLIIGIHHGVMHMILNGFGYEVFGVTSLWWQREFICLNLGLSLIVAIAYIRDFLILSEFNVQLDRLLKYCLWLSLALGLLVFFIPYETAVRIINLFAILVALLCFYAGIDIYMKGYKPARLYIVGWAIVMFGGLVYGLKTWSLLPTNVFTEYAWTVCSAVEMVFLALSLADRINETKTEKENAQELAVANLGKYQALFEQAVEGICRLDLYGNYEDVNESFVKIFGYKDVNEFWESGADKFSYRHFKRSFISETFSALNETGQLDVDEVEAVRKNGETIWVAIKARTIVDSDKNIASYEGFVLDITERKAREQAERERESAELVAATKSEFLASMSHEIRTPLNGVLGMTELLQTTELDNRQAEYVHTIGSSGKALLNVINDILDSAKINAGKLELEKLPFSVETLIEETISIFSLQAQQKNIELIPIIPRSMPDYLIGDVNRIRQVLLNLLSNAFKFTEEGEVAVTVNVYSQGSLTKLRFEIRDTGIGIETQKKEALFQSFTQADTSISRKYGGTGLGLSICKQLVELMGGEIGVESEIGQGATFSFTVKVELGSEAILGEEKIEQLRLAEQLTGKHALIVIKNAHLAHATTEMLQSLNVSVTAVLTTVDAEHMLARANKAGALFDLVVLDDAFANEDSPAAFENLLEANTLIQVPKLLFVSGQLGSKDEDTCLNRNIKPLEKPVVFSRFCNAVGELLSVEIKPLTKRKKTAQRPNLSHLRVLIAEDNQVNRMVIEGMLKRYGIQPVCVENGLQAVEACTEDNRIHYDLVLMDCEMPELDGFTATQEIRRWESSSSDAVAKLNIYALTAHVLKEHRDLALDSGMDGYLYKPVNGDELDRLLSAINNLRA